MHVLDELSLKGFTIRQPQLTAYVEAVVAGELGERRHVVWVVGQLVGLLRDAAGRLLDALVVGILGKNVM
uniref:Uncharacterized protein n=1 Tax=Anguilla anguilla TaxID=7936 RepID=A0A0E9TX64_ANGAN